MLVTYCNSNNILIVLDYINANIQSVAIQDVIFNGGYYSNKNSERSVEYSNLNIAYS